MSSSSFEGKLFLLLFRVTFFLLLPFYYEAEGRKFSPPRSLNGRSHCLPDWIVQWIVHGIVVGVLLLRCSRAESRRLCSFGQSQRHQQLSALQTLGRR
jgi:hypothetical protein